MAILVLQHDAHESAAVLGSFLQADGYLLRTIELFEGRGLPADLDDVDGLLSLGGPMSVDEVEKYPWIPAELALTKAAHEAQVPMVGICLGAQLIAVALGGNVKAMAEPEVGFAAVKLAFGGTIDPVLSGIRWEGMQFHLHAMEIAQLPAGALSLATSGRCQNQAFRLGMTTYGFQYHFEWDRSIIDRVAGDGLLAESGITPAEVAESCDQHYDLYRHQGDRLCESIAKVLFACR